MEQLRNIIRQKLKNILFERKQHTDDEIVQFDEIDLQVEFNILNNLLFNGTLKPIPMVWKNTKSKGGSVNYSYDSLTKEIIFKYLAMSKFLEIPYKTFKDILAHEMIHVKFVQEGDVREGHGWKFQREMNRINNLGFGFNVSLKMEDSSSFNVPAHVADKMKELVAVILDSNQGKNMLTIMSIELFNSEWSLVEGLFNRLIKAGKYKWLKGVAIKSKNPILMKYTKKRTLSKGYSWVTVDDETILKLIDTGTVIKEINLPTE